MHETWSRRQWLRSLGRWLALGGFGGLSARILSRRGAAGAAGGCPRGVTTCGGCPLAADCFRARTDRKDNFPSGG
jgi:hypothetical protein